jgi:hypothetical protein
MQRLASFFSCAVGLLMAVGGAWTVLAQPTVELQCATNRVAKYELLEFPLAVSVQCKNPYDPAEVDLSLEITGPSGRRLVVPAFLMQEYERKSVGQGGRTRDWFYPQGQPGWKARFAPLEVGRHQAKAVLKAAGQSAASAPITFECVASTNPGFVRVSLKDPRYLEFTEGQPYFPIGENLAFIGEGQYVTLSRAEEILGRLAENGANYLRVWTCCEDWAMALEARKSAWGRSWDWRPPFAPLPDAGDVAGDVAGQCLVLSSNRVALEVNPSHPVALKPNTRYVFSGRTRVGGAAVLRLNLHGAALTEPLNAGASNGWISFRREFATRAADSWLGKTEFRRAGPGTAWISDLSLQEAGGGPELLWEADPNRPRRGVYNPVDCFMLDELVAAAGRRGIYLQLCLITRDLYMNALAKAEGPEYDQAIRDAAKLLRYAVARWGYSTHVSAWEYWNEMNPNLPTDRFYTELGKYLETADVYHHLRTTSTWGPSAKDCRHPQLDFADTHFYLRPADKGRLSDEVEAVLERTRWLREQAPRKPVHLGEFGLANDRWQPTDEMNRSRELVDVHNALWASALSGASGTALYWWWDRLDQRNVYPLFRPVSAFIADIPWNSGEIASLSVAAAPDRLRCVGLRSQRKAWFWLFDPAASWAKVVIEKNEPPTLSGVEVILKNAPSHWRRVQWWDTRTGRVAREDEAVAVDGTFRLRAPDFTRDLAGQLGE